MRSKIYNNKAQEATRRLKIDLSWITEMASELKNKGMIQGVHDFLPLKMFEIKQYLDSIQPDFIIELGAGFSTKVFNDYCQENQKEMITFEQSQVWKEEIEKLTGSSSIIQVDVLKDEYGVFYNYDWERYNWREDNILVYVDAPANTFNNRVHPCLDVENMFKAGLFPDTILFDIRANTVLKVLASNSGYIASLGYLMNGIKADKHHTLLTRNY
jgi:hypothetical protein